MHRDYHCRRAKETFGEDFDHVHAWLDELADYGGGYMDMNHRIHRHNVEGVIYVLGKWGKAAAEAAKQHIMDDLGRVEPKDEMIRMYGDKPDLVLWETIRGKEETNDQGGQEAQSGQGHA
jgi:hypothetical protein